MKTLLAFLLASSPALAQSRAPPEIALSLNADSAARAACKDMEGVRIVDAARRATWVIIFTPAATDACQSAAAQALTTVPELK